MSGRRRARRLAAEALTVPPSLDEVDAARRQVEARVVARVARLDDPDVVLPEIDPWAVATLRANQQARGGPDPQQARLVLLDALEDLEGDK